MSRVKGVVGRSIKVSIYDVTAGDVLWGAGENENAAIIERVERDGDAVRFHYKEREPSEIQKELGIMPVKTSTWMRVPCAHGRGCGCSGYVFLHDLRRERFEFQEAG